MSGWEDLGDDLGQQQQEVASVGGSTTAETMSMVSQSATKGSSQNGSDDGWNDPDQDQEEQSASMLFGGEGNDEFGASSFFENPGQSAGVFDMETTGESTSSPTQQQQEQPSYQDVHEGQSTSEGFFMDHQQRHEVVDHQEASDNQQEFGGWEVEEPLAAEPLASAVNSNSSSSNINSPSAEHVPSFDMTSQQASSPTGQDLSSNNNVTAEQPTGDEFSFHHNQPFGSPTNEPVEQTSPNQENDLFLGSPLQDQFANTNQDASALFGNAPSQDFFGQGEVQEQPQAQNVFNQPEVQTQAQSLFGETEEHVSQGQEKTQPQAHDAFGQGQAEKDRHDYLGQVEEQVPLEQETSHDQNVFGQPEEQVQAHAQNFFGQSEEQVQQAQAQNVFGESEEQPQAQNVFGESEEQAQTQNFFGGSEEQAQTQDFFGRSEEQPQASEERAQTQNFFGESEGQAQTQEFFGESEEQPQAQDFFGQSEEQAQAQNFFGQSEEQAQAQNVFGQAEDQAQDFFGQAEEQAKQINEQVERVEWQSPQQAQAQDFFGQAEGQAHAQSQEFFEEQAPQSQESFGQAEEQAHTQSQDFFEEQTPEAQEFLGEAEGQKQEQTHQEQVQSGEIADQDQQTELGSPVAIQELEVPGSPTVNAASTLFGGSPVKSDNDQMGVPSPLESPTVNAASALFGGGISPPSFASPPRPVKTVDGLPTPPPSEALFGSPGASGLFGSPTVEELNDFTTGGNDAASLFEKSPTKAAQNPYFPPNVQQMYTAPPPQPQQQQQAPPPVVHRQPRAVPLPKALQQQQKQQAQQAEQVVEAPIQSPADEIGIGFGEPTVEATSYDMGGVDYSSYNDNEYSDYLQDNASVASYTAPPQSHPQIQGRGDGRPPHAFVSWGFGGRLLTMFPQRRVRLSSFASTDSSSNKNDESEPLRWGNVKMYQLGTLCSDYIEQEEHVNKYPGPLLLPGAQTNQDSIEDFLALEISKATDPSICTLWHVIRFMVRGQGDIQKPDILAELLNHLNTTAPKPVPTSSAFNVSHSLPDDQLKSAMVEIDNLLQAGDREGAVVRAIESELWAQALVISNFVSVAAYRRVVERFVQQTMPQDSNSKSLFMLFAGMGEQSLEGASVASSWQTKLAAILANRTPGDSEVLVKLGDQIWEEMGMVAAAHVCYLAAGVPISSTSGSRIVLVGGDHKSCETQREFVTPSTILRTEIYVYSQMFRNPYYRLEAFQPYRLLLAMWLADIGQVERAYEWVQSIRETIRARSPSKRSGSPTKRATMFPHAFQRQLKIFEDRLLQCESHRLNHMMMANQQEHHKQDGSWMPFKLPSIFAGKRQMQHHHHQHQQPQHQQQQQPPPPMHDHMQQQPQQFHQAQQPVPPPMGPPKIMQPAVERKEEKPEYSPNSANNDNLRPPTSVSSNAPPPPQQEQQQRQEMQPKQEEQQQSSAEDNSKKEQQQQATKKTVGSSWKDWLTQKLIPVGNNATIAKTGEDLNAYYDKDLGRWVFPGQEGQDSGPQKPKAPPKMSEMARPLSAPNGGGPPAGGSNNNAPGPPMGAASFSAGNQFRRGNARSRYVDPLALSGNVAEAPRPATAAPGGAPPPRMIPPGPPKFNVFKPPPVPPCTEEPREETKSE